MTKYVVGFMFDPKGYGVLLIEKKKPKWQEGKLNGIGGKIESGESSLDAMRREFKEETGLDQFYWRYVVTMYGEGWSVDVYTCTDDSVHYSKQTTDEPPMYIGLDELDDFPLISNLYWLIPLCLDKNDGKGHINYYFSNDYKKL